MESITTVQISEAASPKKGESENNIKLSSSHNDAITHPQIRGMVEFDLGYVQHPNFGSVYVKSRFPRLQPKYERNHLNTHDLNALTTNLLEWVRQHFSITGREEYFYELAQAVTLFIVYVNPLPELYSIEMDLTIKIGFLLWLADDEIEDAIENNVPFKSLKLWTGQLIGILKGIHNDGDSKDLQNKFQDVPNYSGFKTIYNALMEWHQTCLLNITDYTKRVEPYHDCLRRYFETQIWFSIDKIDGRYSEETFKHWRKMISHFDGVAELVSLMHGITLPEEIVRSAILRRILEIVNWLGGFVNDLLGMKKEFRNDQTDNLIVFKVLNKNIPLEKAVKQGCKLIETELSDYLLLKAVILKEFDNEKNLVRYLDALDSLIDGHNIIYTESKRHQAVGLVTLTR